LRFTKILLVVGLAIPLRAIGAQPTFCLGDQLDAPPGRSVYGTQLAHEHDSFPGFAPAWAVAWGPETGGSGANRESWREPTTTIPRVLSEDLLALASAPAKWRSRDWAKFGLAVGAVALAGQLDEQLDQASDSSRTADVLAIAKEIRPLGQELGLGLVAATWVVGRVSGRSGLTRFARDGLEASLFAAGLITPTVKAVVGRTRPRDTDEVSTFGFFSGEQSFPSGEATQAFALAAVVAGHSRSPWIKTMAYAAAGLIAAQRVAVDAHWGSDVLAGALIGTAIGNWVVKRNAVPAESGGVEPAIDWAMVPMTSATGRGAGLAVRASF
jgi:membrane-associated phospholipid phosphatase